MLRLVLSNLVWFGVFYFWCIAWVSQRKRRRMVQHFCSRRPSVPSVVTSVHPPCPRRMPSFYCAKGACSIPIARWFILSVILLVSETQQLSLGRLMPVLVCANCLLMVMFLPMEHVGRRPRVRTGAQQLAPGPNLQGAEAVFACFFVLLCVRAYASTAERFAG